MRLRRFHGLIAGLILLAGCTGNFGAAEKVSVTKSNFIIAGPPGYCVDGSATRDDGDSAFVLLGSCASVAGRVGLPEPSVRAVLTASVAPDRGGDVGQSLDALEMFFDSSQGRAALARNGRASSVKLLDTRRGDNLLLLHIDDDSNRTQLNLSNDHWRGFLFQNGQIVTLGVSGFLIRPLSDKVGLDLLRAFVGQVVAHNPPPEPVPQMTKQTGQ